MFCSSHLVLAIVFTFIRINVNIGHIYNLSGPVSSSGTETKDISYDGNARYDNISQMANFSFELHFHCVV
jgi:hypothetical protein